MEWEEFIEKIKIILRIFNLRRFNEKFKIDFSGDCVSFISEEKKIVFNQSDYSKFREDALESEFTCFTVSNEYTYEVIIYQLNKMTRRISPRLEEQLASNIIEDPMNKIKYKFQEISDLMLWNIIREIDIEDLERINMLNFMSFSPYLTKREPESLFDLLRFPFRNMYSIYISSEEPIKNIKVNDRINSILFNFCYNWGCSFRVMSSFEESFYKKNRHNRSFNRDEEVNAPKLSYIQDLTEQYHMAVSSEDPFVQFIGFYHIMEYFYEEVYKAGVVDSVKEILLDPGFSTKRKKDIMKIVDLISKKKIESTVGSELDALELTLKKYIDVDKIIEKLMEIDEDIIEYYKNNKVNFSNGDIVDLREGNNNVFKKLANRIYRTRNSLVRSKSNEIRTNDRGIYNPFKDSKTLLKEIPLLKTISEVIIIKSASEF